MPNSLEMVEPELKPTKLGSEALALYDHLVMTEDSRVCMCMCVCWGRRGKGQIRSERQECAETSIRACWGGGGHWETVRDRGTRCGWTYLGGQAGF